MPNTKLEDLSVQEIEVLFLSTYGDGRTPSEIALRAKVPKEDIERRLQAVAEKMGVENPAGLKRLMYELGWIKQPGWLKAQD